MVSRNHCQSVSFHSEQQLILDQTNPQYPSQSVNVYYRLLNSEIWNPWQVVPAKTTTFTATLDRVAGGVYEILVLPDNVDTSQGVFKVGNAVSCIADQFPYSAPSEFRLLVSLKLLA
jgi:hypothetical protein